VLRESERTVDCKTSRLWDTMREQLLLYEGEKQKWQLQTQLKETELKLELELQEERYDEMKAMFDEKLHQQEETSKQETKKWQEKAAALDEAHKALLRENLELKKKAAESNEFKEILRIRRQLNTTEQTSKENASANGQVEVYRKELERVTEQLKKVRKENNRLQQQLSSKELDLQFTRQELQAKEERIEELTGSSAQAKAEARQQREECARELKHQEQSLEHIRKECHSLQKHREDDLKRSKEAEVGRRIRAELRKRSTAELAKMDQLFKHLEFGSQP
jgi:hypothetical protein